jgi:hypothetical protein
VAVRCHHAGARPPGAIAFRASALAALAGRSGDPVELEQVAFGKGQARWSEQSGPRVLDLETVVPDSLPVFPRLPKQFTPMPAAFLGALAEAARTTSHESVRFALARLQLRGKTGEIVATDGRQLLVQGGFPFPWSDNILIPRMPTFGARALAQEDQIAVGRAKSHVAVKVGTWTFLLTIDLQSRFPDVAAVIPKASGGASRLHLDPQDAAFLAANLSKWPGAENDRSPITLDLHLPVAVRRRDEPHGSSELVLARSTVSGPPVRLCTDRRYLVRAVQLGFDTVEVPDVEKPLVCRGDRRIYIWMPLDRTAAIPPGPGTRRIPSVTGPPPPPMPEPEMKRSIDSMPTPQAHGPVPDPSRANGSTEPERWGIAQVIAEAEALRGLLHDASARTARLLAALKHQRRRSRAVQQAMQSLKELQLDR